MKLAVFFNLPSGGAKRTLYEQVKRLSKNHNVDMYTLSTANHSFLDVRSLVSNYYIYKCDIETSFPIQLLTIYQKLPKLHKKIAEDIEKKEYDCVLVHPDFFTQAPYLLKYLKIPTTYYCHELKREFYEKIPRKSKKMSYFVTLPFRYPLKYIEKQNIKHATGIVTNSHKTQKQIKKNIQIHSYVNYPGVDTTVFIKKDEKKENVVLSVGGFNLLKGHDVVIKALNSIPQNKRPTLVIAGNGGEDKEYLSNRAKDLQVQLIWKENISDNELVGLYNRVKALIFIPQDEPFGLAALEALSCGTRVISVKDAGVTEVLKKIPEVSFVNRDEKQIADEIEKVLIKEPSKNYEKVRDYLDDYLNWDRSIEDLEKILKKTCAK